MIGSLLKQLLLAIPRYISYKFSQSAPTRTSDTPAVALGQTDPTHGSVKSKPSMFVPQHAFDWQALHDGLPSGYGDNPRPEVFQLITHAPRFVLDVGCSGGTVGRAIKERYPEARVWGVEPNVGKAEIARTRLDHVLMLPVDEVDWLQEGVAAGAIDTVILFDVLEHIYDPWKTLLTLRNLIHPQGQVLVSIPNARNLFVLQDLISGTWRYRDRGLLDRTHIRFFTRDDQLRLWYQTGFRLKQTNFTISDRSEEMINRHKDGPFPVTIELKGATIVVNSWEELVSFCADQFLYTLYPANYGELSAEEKHWIDAPHPETVAFAGE